MLITVIFAIHMFFFILIKISHESMDSYDYNNDKFASNTSHDNNLKSLYTKQYIDVDSKNTTGRKASFMAGFAAGQTIGGYEQRTQQMYEASLARTRAATMNYQTQHDILVEKMNNGDYDA